MTYSYTFAHYGVLGMKWGVRRSPEQLGHKRAPKRPTKPERKVRKGLEKDYRVAKKYHQTYGNEKTRDVHKEAYKNLESNVSGLIDKYGKKKVKSLKQDTIQIGMYYGEAAFKTKNKIFRERVLPGFVNRSIDEKRYNRLEEEYLKKK